MKKTLALASIIFFVAGCVSKRNISITTTYEIVNNYHLKQKVYATKNFKIFTLQRISNPLKPVRIYIEGDGRAYIDKYTPSFNPTPVSEFLLDVISRDNSPNVIYIARPCQYIDSKNCQEKYWTNKRFSAEVINSMNEVVDKFSNYQLELVGYSGGAVIIKHLHSKNIINIRTIAGNLDVKEFTKIHRISNLEELEVDYQKLAQIPQIHFVGEQDKIIPQNVFHSYKKHFPEKSCIKSLIIKNAGHYMGWKDKWYNLLQIKPTCNTSTTTLNSESSKNKTLQYHFLHP